MSSFNRITHIVFMVFLLNGVCGASDLQNQKSTVKGDFLGMAAMLLKDGHYQRALMALQSVDITAEDADLIRFYTLQGLAYLSLDDLSAAKHSLQQSVEKGQADKMIWIYLAQTYYGLKEYRKTVESVNKAGIKADEYPGMFEMQAQSNWHLKEYAAAISVLNSAQEKFPKDHRFLRRKVFYLLELGLYQNAAEAGKQYLQRSKASVKEYIAIGNALRLSRQFPEALRILEIANLQFSSDAMVAKVLAHTYMDQGQLNTAAQIFEQAALYNPELTAEAGEIYRRAGRLYRALSLNAGIRDIKVKLKQRLALLLALKRYEAAANMNSALYRTGLLKKESIRYALAYAYFNIGQYDKSINQLKYLKEPELFKKGVELRKVITECQESLWECV